MEAATLSDRQQHPVWPLQPRVSQLELGQQKVLLPDAYVASMQLKQADPVKLGFMCGSLPVPTFKPSDVTGSYNSTEAALIPAIGLQSQRESAPRYRVLPTQTDLNMPPSNSFQEEPSFSGSSSHQAAGSCKAWAGSYLFQPLARKCEALAVNALAGYGDDIDVVAPVDILKQLFKTPYSKARLSLAVHRIGRTLILNCGPDEWRDDRAGGKLSSQKKSRAQMMERTLFSKFVQHSMNADSCDAASTPDSDSQSSTSNGFEELDDLELQQRSIPRVGTQKGKHRVSLGHYSRSRCGGGFETVQKKRYVGEPPRETEFVQKECPPDGQQRPTADTYLRVLFWQFQNLRMLLGSDLLLFSNENHSAVSLRLLEIERQVTPLMWLDAWLDNVMASIPELAVCYHRNGVVQGYELLKTDDIFLMKGLAEDGTAFFHPHVVQQNASTVLRFLQDNCKEDPGTYWLFKNAGEDLMQLFDLSITSKTCSSHAEKNEQGSCTLPSTKSNCSEQYSLPLAMLLYRLTLRLSQSQDPADRHKCAKLFGKCLEFMEEQEHLIIRASGHEHVARLILTSFKEIGSILKPLLLESSGTKETVGTQIGNEVLKLPCIVEEPAGNQYVLPGNDVLECDGRETNSIYSSVVDDLAAVVIQTEDPEFQAEASNGSLQTALESLSPRAKEFSADCDLASTNDCLEAYTHVDEAPTNLAEPQNVLDFVSFGNMSPKSMLTLADPVSSRLAAVHHISQAIKALRWQRQLDVGDPLIRPQSSLPRDPSYNQQFPLCICGEVECVAICDFREIGIGAQMDRKLWRLMLLLGEAYLALGQAYKDEGQFALSLKAVELACLVCGSMPEESENSTTIPQTEKDIRSWGTFHVSLEKKMDNRSEDCLRQSQGKFFQVKDEGWSCTNASGRQQSEFWGSVWVFVGDVYAEMQRSVGEGDAVSQEQTSQVEELTMAQEVMKEVKRLKKKIGQFRGNCGVCSLISCSCQSDRASSGDSASSCNISTINTKYGRKHNKKTDSKKSKGNGDGRHESKSNVNESDPGFSRSTRKNDEGGPESFYNVSQGNLEVGVTSSKLSTDQTAKENLPGIISSDIFSYVRRPVVVDWEANLSAAVECYSTAALRFCQQPEWSADLECTLRKKGWGCNELGRMRLAHGQIKLAEAAFVTAIEAFRGAKDPVNVVLVQCNLGHGQRAAAEALATKLSAWEDCDFLALFVQTIAEAKFLYGEALKFYGMARQELLEVKNIASQSMGGLWNEVHTQLAHTYLRLGMLLAREDKFMHTQWKNSAERSRIYQSKDETPTKNAITKALEIYKSLGTLRVQEAAFSQYQLACYHRDLCGIAVLQVDEIAVKKVENSSFQKAKLHSSLAELYWQKALDFYNVETHSDMFLEVLVERSGLYLLMATSFHQNQMMEQALNIILEGRRAFISEEVKVSSENSESRAGKNLPGPSAKVRGKFTQQVQMILKKMLANTLSSSKSSIKKDTISRHSKNADSAGHGDSRSGTIKTGEIVKLKQMYRLALQTQEVLDWQQLYNLWAG